MTLHNIDEANAKSGMSFADLLFGGRERAEISNEIRQSVDQQIKEQVEAGTTELLPGVLFIDECSMLDIETFAFLNRAMEHELSPIIIFATNRGITTVKGTDIKSPHGMPLDLLDRLLIINTRAYDKEDIKEIIKIRAEAEHIEIEDSAIETLVEIGTKTSLRYAVQLLAPAAEVAKANGLKKVTMDCVKSADELFADVKESVQYLKEVEKKMMYD